MLYAGRPGVSPALAVLLAQERVKKRHAILDVGCGTGTDALLLAKWGFRQIQAIDPEAKAVGTARSRAKRWRLDGRIEFRHMGAESLTKTFGPRTFDVVLHTLVANNLQKRKDAHFRAVASVMKPDALLILQERVTRRHENQRPGSLQPLAQLRKYFDLSAGILTHLPEHRAGTSSPGYARVALWLGRPRR